MAKSQQKQVGRVRPPRVHITYDVQVGDAMEKKHLPFVVGVLADLSGQPKEPLKPLNQRPFTEVDRDNFNSFMDRQAPRLVVRVPDKLTGLPDSNIPVELTFKDMEDFEPARVAEKVPPLKELLDVRQRLNNLLASMEGNDKMEKLLEELMANTEKALALAKEKGLSQAPETPMPKTEE
jgi:type VI secretion system protein ImpB